MSLLDNIAPAPGGAPDPKAGAGGTPAPTGGAPDPKTDDNPGADDAGKVFFEKATGEKYDDFLKTKDEKGLYLGKYKTVNDLAKGYTELTNKLREKGQAEPPPEYKFDFSKHDSLKDVFDGEHGLLKTFLPVFKEAKLSQDQANALVEAFAKNELAQMVNPEAELQKLGTPEQQQQLATKIRNGVPALVEKAPDEVKAVLSVLENTADGIKTLNFILDTLSRDMGIPASVGKGDFTAGKTAAELRQEAFDYQKLHAATIGGNRAQQAHYDGLLTKAWDAEQRAKK
jgi:hypothetical protein